MKKKFYTQPQTDQMSAAPQSVLCISVIEDPQSGITSEAPARWIRGLKYL